MIRNGEASLDVAVERLNRAMEALEAKLAEQAAQRAAEASQPAASDDDAVHIALRETRLREKALEAAAAEASLVLGRAAEQIRAALEDEAATELDEDGFYPDDDPDSLDHLSDDQTDMHPREF
jgi:hypothetical protein